MLYGSELWGLKNVAHIENVHVCAYKRFGMRIKMYLIVQV